MYTTNISVSGQLIDSGLLLQVFDSVANLGGEFKILQTEFGKTKAEKGRAIIQVGADTCEGLDKILSRVKELGAEVLDGKNVQLAIVEQDGVCPDGFYASTNIETYVCLDGQWVPVDDIEMDCAIVVDTRKRTARCCPIARVVRGQHVVVGASGIRVASMASARATEVFSFMGSDVSSERPKALIVEQVASEMKEVRNRGGKILVIAGPAVVHTGAGCHLSRLIDAGYVNLLYAGNAVATHDVEWALLGTSLGVRLDDGTSAPMGHTHHLRAINAIRKAGGLKPAVKQGVLTKGVMHSLITNDVPYVLAGSIRDDGPLPDVITDAVEAQDAMRKNLKGVEIALMLSTMLHAIATGNLLPARVKTICVDINPAVVTKLADRGTFQAIGIVSDVEWFLKELAGYLAAD
ncbi:MAG: TIGR00300 family protein [Firmicutes bacterium]|nr:TIGR00300 family protein [Bacillota bacterium]MDD4793094.1 TIGR00300 family protein [Bacillota bacterium]